MPSTQKKIRDLERLQRRKAQAAANNQDGEVKDAAVAEPDTEALGNSNPIGRAEAAKIREDEGLRKTILQLKEDREANKLKEKKRKNAVKYHMVRFLERKRTTRMIRQLDSKIKAKGSSDEEENNAPDKKKKKRKKDSKSAEDDDSLSLKELSQQRLKLEDDLTYIMYYPMEHKYISLFGDTANSTNANTDKQSSAASEKSRLLATKARKLDISEGRKDKVLHAIEVEYNPSKGLDKNGADKDAADEFHNVEFNDPMGCDGEYLTNSEEQRSGGMKQDPRFHSSQLKGVGLTEELDSYEEKEKNLTKKKPKLRHAVETDQKKNGSSSCSSSYSNTSKILYSEEEEGGSGSGGGGGGDDDDDNDGHDHDDDYGNSDGGGGNKDNKNGDDSGKVEDSHAVEDGDDFFLEEAGADTGESEGGNLVGTKRDRNTVGEIRSMVNKKKMYKHRRLFDRDSGGKAPGGNSKGQGEGRGGRGGRGERGGIGGRR